MNKEDDYIVPEGRWRHMARRWSVRDQGPTTVCFASLCRYANNCPNKTTHPRRLSLLQCPRYWPEVQRPAAGLSEHILKLLGEPPTET